MITFGNTIIKPIIEEKILNINFDANIIKSITEEKRINITIKEDAVIPKVEEKRVNITKEERPVIITYPIGMQGPAGEKGDKGDPGSGSNAEQIQGVPVSSTPPEENQTLIFDGEQWTPAFLNKPSVIELTAEDISRGYTYLNPSIGSIGEKEYIDLVPDGAPLQEYGTDYTVMNSDNNEYLVLIWTTSKPIVGILYPVYPTEGIDLFEEGDKVQIFYNKE